MRDPIYSARLSPTNKRTASLSVRLTVDMRDRLYRAVPDNDTIAGVVEKILVPYIDEVRDKIAGVDPNAVQKRSYRPRGGDDQRETALFNTRINQQIFDDFCKALIVRQEVRSEVLERLIEKHIQD